MHHSGINMILYHYLPGQTPLDENEKKALIPSIITREDLDRVEQENILEARMWLMKKAVLNKLSLFNERFLLNLHKRMFGHVWKWAGQYRKSDKNIGVPYYQVHIELKQLLDDANFWLVNQSFDILTIAVMIHHRLVKIHLFANGNGRHARLVADAIVSKYNCQSLTWGGSFDLTKPNEIRKRYIHALREADNGNYEPILLFAKS
jgi:Fic-DOC domain mobile mystery protein B